MNRDFVVVFTAADGKRCHVRCNAEVRIGTLAAHLYACRQSATYRVRQLSGAS